MAPDLRTANEDFPFMAWRDTVVAGLAARVARISFSGELAYEINVAWHDAAALWTAVWAAGEPIGLTPVRHRSHARAPAPSGHPRQSPRRVREQPYC